MNNCNKKIFDNSTNKKIIDNSNDEMMKYCESIKNTLKNIIYLLVAIFIVSVIRK